MKIILVIISILLSFSIAWADDAIKISCPSGVNPNKALQKTTIIKHQIDKNSYEENSQSKIINEKGKCFKFNSAKFEYLVDKKHAIYSMFIDESYDSAHRLFLFDFENSEVKWTKIGGIIKTTGEYFNYKDRKNVPRTMPRMIVVKENII
jgi:hypothetical protein